ncbi:Glutamine-fructose-6-phosphate transaminase (Isomerizing) [Alteracholeplasma palmae J233]|uniref:Glutamine--fructose-6-phosphate aminotransferase [isomerizing] n=1 Tax=Alteracholeplasma palmae (strain ATCC 49389 / J233) TaxID=1318466 RepID=U4KLH6_ALTPJ|nr:glutamine--fructose-6-phosphate transaminase (isomerizing) [Alteracholeplasma palmae]CCV64688.1 Glutamine-fructose-6-phosphate transaminase (Isomerizing) [Alteracholeplasma palmae J233]
MCGIVGYIGTNNARDIIIHGLERLEYRGYDSAGLAILNKDNLFDIYKDVGRVSVLSKSTNKILSNIGIGHTRWATHGKVTTLNAHPHKSPSGRFMIVHNGVIENFSQLKEQYLKGHTFLSETDTEVIAHLIEGFATYMEVENAILTTLKLLHGSYALLILDTQNPDKLYAAKDKPPLLVGKNTQGFTISSDVLALAGYATEYHVIEDKTFVVTTKNGIKFYNYDHEELDIKFKPLNIDVAAAEKGNYDHFMLKEINEQPGVIRNIISKYFNNYEINLNPSLIKSINNSSRIYILAAGTSMHAGLVGKRLLEQLTNKPVEVHIASEFAYYRPILDTNPFFILISQSGETADLRACLTYLRSNKYKTLTITNVITSTLAREADYALEIYAGPEIAVASTKAYIAQISVLAILAYELSAKDFDLKLELSKVAQAIENFLADTENLQALVSKYFKKEHAFYIGRGIDYATALEAALKLKEISYIHTEGFAAGELKHGTIALIEDGTPVIALISDETINLNTRSNLHEVKSRGAIPIIVTLESLKQKGDDIILDDVHPLLTPLVMVVPTQLISYYAALNLGFDIDKPRNLAKSVTVE